MNAFFNWLFSTNEGALALMGIGMVFFMLLAWLLEFGIRRRYHDHPAEDEAELAREAEESFGRLIGKARRELEAEEDEEDPHRKLADDGGKPRLGGAPRDGEDDEGATSQ